MRAVHGAAAALALACALGGASAYCDSNSCHEQATYGCPQEDLDGGGVLLWILAFMLKALFIVLLAGIGIIAWPACWGYCELSPCALRRSGVFACASSDGCCR